MKRHGTAKLIVEKNDGSGNIECIFPETISLIYLQDVYAEVETKDNNTFKKTFGYRIFVELTIKRLPLSFYSKKYPSINIQQQYDNFGKLMNEVITHFETNKEVRVIPFYTGENDFFIDGILDSDSIDFGLSGFYKNLGQEVPIIFCTPKYCDGENYSPSIGETFFLPEYLLYKGE